jgi:diadenosine tetraphosphate (Ap4A) HIT family hydrolase
MIIQTMSEYAPEYTPYRKKQSSEFKLALDLVADHRALDLHNRSIRKYQISLEVLLHALLTFSNQNGFVKYNPWDKTIQVKHFKQHMIAYQYNPFREPKNRHANGQKVVSKAGKKTDFLDWETFPKNEHYLIWTASSGRRYGILVQPAPIVPGHLIVASLDLNPKTNRHYDQFIRYFQVADMHELQEKVFALGYAMGYNDRGAGASVDHFHTQLVPGTFMPIVRACHKRRLEIERTYSNHRGVDLKIIHTRSLAGPLSTAYPSPAFLLEADRSHPMLTKKRAIVKQLQACNIIFNSLAWQQPNGRYTEAFFPRSQESLMSNAFKAGYVEMSGMLVMPNKALYETMKRPSQGALALEAVGLSAIDYKNFLKHIYHYFD